VPARFYTITDSAFYVGTVVLLNSLRLTGHDQELVVLDCGLTDAQSESLASVGAALVPAPTDLTSTYLQKPYPAILDPDGVVVLIDSDMAVTDSLNPVIERAERGQLCVFPDHPTDLRRWFGEWHELLALRAPLRRQVYVNAGFVALEASRWLWLLERWRELCLHVEALEAESRGAEAFSQHDQDVFNALLMSEVPEGAVVPLPAYELDLRRVVVEDSDSLVCTFRGERQPILHLALSPKVWQRGGWKRVGTNAAYVELAPRLLFGADVALRLDPSEVPAWLRAGSGPRLVARAVSPASRFRTVPARIRRIPRRALREMRRGIAAVRARGEKTARV
jgi:hypothetical protein